MAKFQNVYTDISTVNSGNQFGNEPLSANAINVALQNTQALKNGTIPVANATTATGAYSITETAQIKLGAWQANYGGERHIMDTQIAFENSDSVFYSGKWYSIISPGGSPYVQCSQSDPIGQAASGTAITVLKSVQSKVLWILDKKWTEIAANGDTTVEVGGTYQIIVQSTEIAQAIIQIVGDGYYLLGTNGTNNLDTGSILVRTYKADVRRGRLRVFKTDMLGNGNYSHTNLSFRIRKIG